jgi:SHS2 domain-containing protein
MDGTFRPVPAGPRPGARHELLDHTSEVTLRLFAPTFSELLGEATRAFGELVPESLRSQDAETSREIRISGPDRVALLVAWLNEVVYATDADAWLPSEVESVREDEDGMTVRARGVALRAPFVLVKAATLHRASVREHGAGLEGEVTLDV